MNQEAVSMYHDAMKAIWQLVTMIEVLEKKLTEKTNLPAELAKCQADLEEQTNLAESLQRDSKTADKRSTKQTRTNNAV